MIVAYAADVGLYGRDKIFETIKLLRKGVTTDDPELLPKYIGCKYPMVFEKVKGVEKVIEVCTVGHDVRNYVANSVVAYR